jgi:precorrin-6B methylase 2
MSDSWKEGNSREIPEGMDPMKVMQVASAYWQSRVLHVANRLDVFNILGESKKHLDTLVKETESDKRCLSALLSALVSFDFLSRTDDVFCNNEFGKIFLVTSSKYYQGGIIYMFENWYEAWGDLYDTVKNGKASALMHQTYNDKETRSYMMGMHNRALAQSVTLTNMVDLSGRKQLMDVGCGPATFAVMFCKRYNGLNAIAMDRAQNLKIATEIVEKYNMEDRIKLLPGDYYFDSLGRDNDAMLLSSVTNQESPENLVELLKKCCGSMSKNGIILIQEQLLNAEKNGPELAALIGVNQTINTLGGSSYSTREMEAFMSEAGFVDIECRQMGPPSPFMLLTGYKR